MFLLGHLGVGSKLASPLSRGLSRGALLLGTVLPDLIDKPIYYGLVLLQGREQTVSGLIAGTRSFGHTALLLLALTAVSILRRSKYFAALALGVATHLLLDNVYEVLMPEYHHSALVALLWPLQGWQFAVMNARDVGEHLAKVSRPPLLIGEIAGFGILAWDEWTRRNTSRIVALVRAARTRGARRFRGFRERRRLGRGSW